MINEKIINYIKDCKAQGFEDKKIKEALLTAGWEVFEIKEAFININSNDFEEKKEDKLKTEEVENIEKKVNQELESQKQVQNNNKSEEVKVDKSKKSKSILKIIIYILVPILIAVIAFFVYSSFFTKPSFAKIMQKSMSTMEEIYSLNFETNLKVETRSLSDDNLGVNDFLAMDNFDLNLSFDYFIDFKDDNFLNSSKFFIETDIFGEMADLSFELRSLDKDEFFIKVNSLPTIAEMFVPNTLIDQWISIPLESDDYIIGGDINDLLEAETISRLRNILVSNLLKHDIVIILEEDEISYENMDLYYYDILIGGDNFDKFVLATIEDIYNEFPEFFNDKSLAEVLGDMDDDLDDVEDINIKFWINKDNYLPYRISWETEMINEIKEIHTKIEYDLIFKAFNDQVIIERPDNALNIEQVMEIIDESFGLFESDFETDFEFTFDHDDSFNNLHSPFDDLVNINEVIDYGLVSDSLDISIFSRYDCPFCKEVEDFIIENNLFTLYNIDIIDVSYNNLDNIEKFYNYSGQCEPAVSSAEVPMMYHDRTCLTGSEPIIHYLNDL